MNLEISNGVFPERVRKIYCFLSDLNRACARPSTPFFTLLSSLSIQIAKTTNLTQIQHFPTPSLFLHQLNSPSKPCLGTCSIRSHGTVLPSDGALCFMHMVARGRFELPSAGPKPAMLVHYTTGLRFSTLLEIGLPCSYGFSFSFRLLDL